MTSARQVSVAEAGSSTISNRQSSFKVAIKRINLADMLNINLC
ncbi:MAG: hypothetical protein AAF267_08625 [Deinococcota bacterium]